MSSFLQSIVSPSSTNNDADRNKGGRSPLPGTSPAQFNAKCNAYELRVVLSGLPLVIESICGHDNNLLVGTKEGHLLIYKVVVETGFMTPKPIEVHITHSNKHFSKKPILQLDVIPEHQVLISLTGDNGISVHDMALYQCPSIATIDKTKGATLFSLDIQRQKSLTGNPTLTVRMCVVVGKRLQLFYWKNRVFHVLREDFYVADTPKTITWCTETLCIGFRSEYMTLSLLTGETSELCSTGKQGEPIIAKIADDRFALVQDKRCILKKIGESGIEPRVWTEWSEIPTSIVYDEPYIIGIHSGKYVEVRTTSPKLVVGTFHLPTTTTKLLTRSSRGIVYIASNDVVWCLKSTPIDVQIDAFLKQQHFKLALSLAHVSDAPESDKAALVSKIQMQNAFHLFCKKNFEEAMKVFEKLETDVPQVIGMFPNLLPPEYQQKMVYSGKLPELEGSDLEKGLTALQGFLTHMRVKYVRNLKPSSNDPSSMVEGATLLTLNKKKVLQIIDTTLLKCYLKTKESLVASLLRLKDNYCHYDETEKILKRENKIDELIILYNSKEEHRKALNLLQQQFNIQGTIDYLQNLGMEHIDTILENSKWVLLHSPEEGLKIFTEEYPEVESFPRAKVYDFLEKNFRDLVIPYLKHLIFTWKETNPIFHNALIHHYREQVMSERDPDVAAVAKVELIDFLKTSNYYTPESVIIYIPYHDMHEERALLLEKLGRHEQALSIYVTLLKDRSKAMDYCQRVYDKGDKNRKEVYTILMRMLLNPPTTLIPGIAVASDEDALEPDLPAALALLHAYAPCIEPIKALLCLPDDVKVSDIQNFLKTSVQNHHAEKRKLLLTRGLAEAEYRKAMVDKVQLESEKFSVPESTICAVCGKRIASQRIISAFARYPDGSIVHYGCLPSNPGQT